MKRLTIVFVAVVLIFSGYSIIAAGGKDKAAPGEEGILIGEVIYNLGQPYQQAHAKNAELYAEELGIDLIIVDGRGSSDVIISAVEDLIAKGVQGIIIQPGDAEAINVSIDEAHDAGVAVVTFFNKQTRAKAPFVKLEEHDICFEMGKFAVKKWTEFYPDKPIKVGIISEPQVDYVRYHRAGAFADGVMEADPTAEIVTILDGMGVRDKSLQAGEDMLQAHPEVNIIYGINNDSVLGALAAYEAAGRGKAVNGKPLTEIFFGTDGTEGELLKIANPSSSFKVTMALQPKDNARVLIDTLLKILDGEIDMRSEYETKSLDFIIDGWSMDIDYLQGWLEDQYFSQINLKEEIGL